MRGVARTRMGEGVVSSMIYIPITTSRLIVSALKGVTEQPGRT